MGNSFSIVYITNRKDCLFDWFLDGLKNQVWDFIVDTGRNIQIQVVFVDFYKNERVINFELPSNIEITHVESLPSSVQGKHKLTKIDYYNGSLATNTGFIYCKHPYVVGIADLSILGENWLKGVMEAIDSNIAFCGAYRKDKNMVEKNGKLISSNPEGYDSRMNYLKPGQTKIGCSGAWMYGASFGAPLENFLAINGCDEICAMVGTEDTQMGARMQRTAIPIYYDTNILTVESVEHHFYEGAYFRRESFPCSQEDYFARLADYSIPDRPERSSETYDLPWYFNDLLKYLPKQKESFKNPYSIRELREKVLRGEEITVEDMKLPTHLFWTGKPLSDY